MNTRLIKLTKSAQKTVSSPIPPQANYTASDHFLISTPKPTTESETTTKPDTPEQKSSKQ
jgi:hypothetical protein